MYPYLGDFELGKTIFFPFATFNSSGASVTLTGLAVTDIEVYKGASMTQRSSDAGYALVDTDGIDLDTITGIHGFTIDTSDNTDAGFYAAGNDYTVVVSAVTVDSQTVNFIAGRFSLQNRSSSGVVKSGTLSGTHSSTTADLGTGAPSNDISGQTVFFPSHGLSRMVDSYNTGTGVATFSPSVAVTLADGNPWMLIATPPGSTGAPMPANAVQLGGSTQSLDDLKDFADAGYDPATNKVQGVVLTDTVTTITNGQDRYQKNVAAADIPFVLVDSTDHVTRKTGITVTATRSIDGAAFGSATGTVSEVANGVYSFDASQADMNGNNIVFRFTGAACDPVELHIKTYT